MKRSRHVFIFMFIVRSEIVNFSKNVETCLNFSPALNVLTINYHSKLRDMCQFWNPLNYSLRDSKQLFSLKRRDMCLLSCSLQPNSELLTVNFSNQRRDMCQFWYSFELPSTVLTVNFLKERRDMCRFWYPLEPALKVLTVNFFTNVETCVYFGFARGI